MHVVVLGAGYAGVTLTRLLERTVPESVDLTLVDESPDHLVQHELHRVIRRPELAAEITVSLPEIVDRATVRVARVEGIDRETRTVTLSDGSISYDVAAICLGAETAFYGLEGVREHATPLKRLVHARRIRAAFFDLLETDGREVPGGGSTGGPRIVVGGAGLSGVQVAGEIAALAREERVDASVVLLEQFDDVAPGFPAGFRRAVRSALEARDVDVRTGTTVTGADPSTIHLDDVPEHRGPDQPDDERLTAGRWDADEHPDLGGVDDDRRGFGRADDEHDGPGQLDDRGHRESDRPDDGERLAYDLLIWTGGIRGSDVLDGTRPTVRSDLRLDDRTFVCGDAARVIDADGEPVPASAQSAVREARTVATNVARIVDHEGSPTGGDTMFEPRLEQFRFDSPGWLVSVGDGAVAQVGPAVVTGRAAKLLKTTVGVGYLSAIGGLRNAADFAYGEFAQERRD